MGRDKPDLPQGTLDILVLRIVGLGATHGYGIARRMETMTQHALSVPEGSLYPALHRLEDRGLLAAEWKPSETGREAKFYRLTPKGRTHLKVETANWERMSAAVHLILRPGSQRP